MILPRDTLTPTRGKRPEAILLFMAEEEESRQKGLRSYIAISEIVAEFSRTGPHTKVGWFRNQPTLVKKAWLPPPRIKEDAQLYLILTAKGHKWVAERSRLFVTHLGEGWDAGRSVDWDKNLFDVQ